MTWTVDSPVRIGKALCAGICDLETKAFRNGTVVHGSKTPRLILWVTATAAIGLDLNGNRYAAEEIELAYPGAIPSLREQLET